MLRALAAYRERGYTHAPVGAFVSESYHGQTPPHSFQDWERGHEGIAARLEMMLAHGIIPVVFLSPDNWTLEQMKQFEPVWRTPRWQQIVKVMVPFGYEPSIDTPNSDWVARLKWARDVFPNALSYIHMVSDFDAPGNNDDLTPNQPGYIGNEGCWANVVPYLHGWLVQNGPWYTAPNGDLVNFRNFCEQFRADVHGSLRQRFDQGYAGWPTFSAWGPNEGLDLIAAEYCSYAAWHHDLPEDSCQQWGDGALSSGADGVFDGFHK